MKFDLSKLKSNLLEGSILYAEDTFRFGKYQGFKVGDIARVDPNYIVSMRDRMKFEESVLHSCQRFNYDDKYDQSGFTSRYTGKLEEWNGPIRGDAIELYTFY